MMYVLSNVTVLSKLGTLVSQTLAPRPTPKAFGASRGKSEVTVCRRLVGQVYNEKDPNSGGGGKRKAKKSDSKVASQLGLLVTFADRGCLNGGPGNMSIADGKSPRLGVCCSTFGAETQACVEGLEDCSILSIQV